VWVVDRTRPKAALRCGSHAGDSELVVVRAVSATRF